MALRNCLDCHTPFVPASNGVSRCINCRRILERVRVRASSTERGYDATYQRNRRILLSDPNAACPCGSTTDLQADHIIPVSSGVIDNNILNLRILCGTCNRRRSNKPDGDTNPPIGPA